MFSIRIQELNELKAETVVLARTETLLKKQWDELRIKLNIIESERGVQGYTEVQDRLEQVSSLKAQIDDAKGKTLEQMSQLVTDITTTLKDRKSKLAPQVKKFFSIFLFLLFLYSPPFFQPTFYASIISNSSYPL